MHAQYRICPVIGVNYIILSVDISYCTIVVLLNLSPVFDTTDHGILIKYLEHNLFYTDFPHI